MLKLDKIHHGDCLELLNKIDDNSIDLIFLDPPYKEDKINYLIEKIKNDKLMKNDGIIIIHRHKKDNLKITNRLNILDSRNYGISKIIIGN